MHDLLCTQRNPGAEVVSFTQFISPLKSCEVSVVMLKCLKWQTPGVGSLLLFWNCCGRRLCWWCYLCRPSCQNRIEEAHTSDTLKKTVGMTRSMDMAAEREKGEQARAAAQRAKDLRVESKDTSDSRYVASARG